jgi:ankyrin repeat protein
MAPRPSQNDIDAYVTAASRGDVAKLTDWLDRFGAGYVDACNSDGHPALSEAAQNKQTDAALTLLDRGADISFEGLKGTYAPIICAASRGLAPVVRALLEMGADANVRLSITGHRPLHYAVMNGFTEVALMLLAYGADITAKVDSGWQVREPGWLVPEDSPTLKAMREWKESDREAWHRTHGDYDPGTSRVLRQKIARRQFNEVATQLTGGAKEKITVLPKIVLLHKGP